MPDALPTHHNTSTLPCFFWLHIKKCGGQSFRKSFSPPYIQTNRAKNPKPFVAAPVREWNDILNNYRIPLGEYDYHRMSFAKKFLFSQEEFESMYKFVIVRNPYARIVSCWKYLSRVARVPFEKKIRMKMSFSCFLKFVSRYRRNKSNRLIATHTAPIWPDITDQNGQLLVNDIYYLERIDRDVHSLNNKLGTAVQSFSRVNRGPTKKKDYRRYYTPTTRKMVETLYADDIRHLGYSF